MKNKTKTPAKMSAKTPAMATAKASGKATAKSSSKAVSVDEVARTIRMPRHLWEAVSEHSSAMTAKGRGRWSANLVVVAAISDACKQWETELAAEGVK